MARRSRLADGAYAAGPDGQLDAAPAAPSLARRVPSQTIDVAIVTPPHDVAERLKLAGDALAVVRRRVRSLDGEPYGLKLAGDALAVVRRRVRSLAGEPYFINDSYFPLDLATGTEIMNPTDIARGASTVLAERGYHQARALDEIYVRMPTPDEVHRLNLGPGTPVAMHVITGFTDDGQPVRVALNILPGDRHAIVWERERPAATP